MLTVASLRAEKGKRNRFAWQMLVNAANGQPPQDESEYRLLVQLPPGMRNFFTEAGYESTIVGEQRSCARLRVRCAGVIESSYTPPFLNRPDKRYSVLIKDLSRSGIGILCHTQIYPTERFYVEVKQHRLSVTVVRCRKLGPLCYEVGAKINSTEAL